MGDTLDTLTLVPWQLLPWRSFLALMFVCLLSFNPTMEREIRSTTTGPRSFCKAFTASYRIFVHMIVFSEREKIGYSDSKLPLRLRIIPVCTHFS